MTVTFEEAMAFVAERGESLPVANERRAARELVKAGITAEDLDNLQRPEHGFLRKLIDRILGHD